MRAMPARPTIGLPAPPLEAVDADGQPWSSTDLVGTTVVAIFHRHIH